MTARQLIVCLLLLIMHAAPAFAAGEESFTFAVISDTHLAPAPGSWRLHHATDIIVSSLVNEVKPSFVLHCGDMISINSHSAYEAAILSMWDTFNAGVRAPLTAAGIAFFPSPGNHDVYGMGRALYGKEWASFRNKGIALDSGSYGSYYSFHYGRCFFIMLDGSGISIPAAQQQWLAKVLAKAKPAYGRVFVISHVGLLGGGRHPGDFMQGNLSWFLEKKGVDYFLSGHQHSYSVDKLGKMIHLTCGSAGETPPYYYLVFTVKGQKVTWEAKTASSR
ncbi:MAG: metallophosphoesterase [Candidatus Eremiobacteraeota bacterium]|nr:metallophosphoesterase [Candidatus Eremiobacteraeota bacterium]